MKKIFFFLILLILIFCNASAQERFIKGKVLLANQAVAGVFVQVVNPQTNNIIAFGATKADGAYDISCKTKLAGVLLKITYISYNQIDTLINLEKEITNLDFNLQKNNQTLAPVNIIVTKPIQVNGDTTNYIIAGLKKDEKSIEALIKKLPGFEIDEKGKIKFKNKPIKTILLDGDDVVNDDYQVLSKNITPEMVDQIQAIENYNSNELMSGIAKGEETVLNLKINKKFKGVAYIKTQASSAIIDSLHEVENTGLAIFKNLKIVNAFNRNNISKYNNANSITENNQEKSSTSNALINNNYLSHLSEENNTKFNNAWANNFNLFYKQKGGGEINVRYAYFKDVQTAYNFNETNYLSNNPPTKLQEDIQKRTKAQIHEINLSAKIYTSKLSFLTFKAQGNFITSLLSNENKNTFNTLATKNSDTVNFNNLSLYFIKKLNLKNALEIEINRTYKKNPQSILITPGLYTSFFNTINYDSIYQPANLKDKNWNTEFRITGRNDWIYYKIKTGFTNQNTQYNSSVKLLNNSTIESADSLINNTKILDKILYFSTIFEKSFVRQKLNIKMENYCQYSFIDLASSMKSALFYNPNLQLIYNTGVFSSLTFSYSKKSSFGESRNYVNNYFFEDYKVLQKNTLTEALVEKKDVFSLHYANVNLFKNQRAVFIGTTYTTNSSSLNHYLENYSDYNIARNEILKMPVRNFSILNYVLASKRLRLLQNTIKFSLFYILNKAKSVHNNSGVTEFRYNVLSSSVGLISNFKGPINYEIKIGFNYNSNKTVSNSFNNHFKNTNYNASANLHIRLAKSLKSNVYFQYNKNTAVTYYMNADIEYDFSKKDLAVSVGGNNLFNDAKIVNYYATEFTAQQNESRLLPRFVYLKLSYNFSFKL